MDEKPRKGWLHLFAVWRWPLWAFAAFFSLLLLMCLAIALLPFDIYIFDTYIVMPRLW